MMLSPSAPACGCPICVRACERKPGWFMPGEAEQLATRMGLSLQELFDRHLVVDWWAADDDLPAEVSVLSPAFANYDSGALAGSDPYGRCRWLTADRKCSIHALGKPAECRATHHDPAKRTGPDHLAIAHAWNTPEHQAQIERLLGAQ